MDKFLKISSIFINIASYHKYKLEKKIYNMFENNLVSDNFFKNKRFLFDYGKYCGIDFKQRIIL